MGIALFRFRLVDGFNVWVFAGRLLSADVLISEEQRRKVDGARRIDFATAVDDVPNGLFGSQANRWIPVIACG